MSPPPSQSLYCYCTKQMVYVVYHLLIYFRSPVAVSLLICLVLSNFVVLFISAFMAFEAGDFIYNIYWSVYNVVDVSVLA